jgi:hypothetical protein
MGSPGGKIMATQRQLILSELERCELEQTARTAVKAYQRERASALLKIADGKSAHWVAKHGLLVERDPDTVYGWLNGYEQKRQARQEIASGRGRKPAFSPSARR